MARKDQKLRGDKIRDLLLLIYLNEKYGGGKVRISALKETLGYSTGGIYNALDESGYFMRRGDVVTLSQSGQEYVKKQWIPYLQVVNPFSYFLIFIGSLLFMSWFLRTYYSIILVFGWYEGLLTIAVGLILRFAFSRIMYWFYKLRKKM
jgi:hypothetical protein